jgi:hypothetical protein
VLALQGAHAADQRRHLRHREVEQVGLVDEQLPRANGCGVVAGGAVVVAEAIGRGLERGEGRHVGLLLRGVGAAGCEGHLHVVAASFGRLLDGRTAPEHDHVGERDLLVALLRTC